MHEGVTAFLSEFSRQFAGGDALDIGGRNINGHGRGPWPLSRWEVVDIRDGEGVTVVADATLPRPEFAERFDLVICTETFEHVEDWRGLVRNAAAWLKPGGGFLITCAGPDFPEHSAYDGMPRLFPGEHYANVSVDEVAEAMRSCGFDVLDGRQVANLTYVAARKPEAPDG